jgi:hypothetical protein
MILQITDRLTLNTGFLGRFRLLERIIFQAGVYGFRDLAHAISFSTIPAARQRMQSRRSIRSINLIVQSCHSVLSWTYK